MQRQIHVKSYIKRDGTKVKEHFRNIDTITSFLPNNSEIPPLDKQ